MCICMISKMIQSMLQENIQCLFGYEYSKQNLTKSLSLRFTNCSEVWILKRMQTFLVTEQIDKLGIPVENNKTYYDTKSNQSV